MKPLGHAADYANLAVQTGSAAPIRPLVHSRQSDVALDRMKREGCKLRRFFVALFWWWRKSRRGSPSGPRLRRPGREGGYRRRVSMAFGPGRRPTGGFRFDILSQRKRLAIHGQPPAGFFRWDALPALPAPRVTPAGSSGR